MADAQCPALMVSPLRTGHFVAMLLCLFVCWELEASDRERRKPWLSPGTDGSQQSLPEACWESWDVMLSLREEA